MLRPGVDEEGVASEADVRGILVAEDGNLGVVLRARNQLDVEVGQLTARRRVQEDHAIPG